MNPDPGSRLPRYAVLWDRQEGESRPVGIAIERDGHVHVDVDDEYGIRSRFDGDYRVMQPRGTRVVYRPGDDGYFDQVLLDLSTAFAVGEQGVVEDSDDVAANDLLRRLVIEPRDYCRVAEYDLVLGAGTSSILGFWGTAFMLHTAVDVPDPRGLIAGSGEVEQSSEVEDLDPFPIAA